MKLSIRFLLTGFILLVISISLLVFVGCGNEEQKGDNVGAGPTIEDMSNSDTKQDKDEVVEDAIRMSEEIMKRLDSIKVIESSMVYINHEAVLVAVKLENGAALSKELEDDIKDQVYDIYPQAKTIAISDDDYVYTSISRLLKTFKENDPIGELIKDLQEILKSLWCKKLLSLFT